MTPFKGNILNTNEIKVGDKFGDLTVLSIGFYLIKEKQKIPHAVCKCSCGELSYPAYVSLRRKVKPTTRCKTCSDKNRERKHGLVNHPLYSVIDGMKQRCYNPKHRAYPNYGGRGITICDRWLGKDGYLNFKEDMSEGYSESSTLKRFNNEEGFSKENCYWGESRNKNK